VFAFKRLAFFLPLFLPENGENRSRNLPLGFKEIYHGMSVTLYVRIKNKDGKYVYAKPVLAGNRRLRVGYALIDGKPEPHPEAIFALRFSDNGKRRWLEVGTDANQAIIAKQHQEHVLNGRRLGEPVVSDLGRQQQEQAIEKRPIGRAIESYLARLARRSKGNTVPHFESAIRFFAQSIVTDDLNVLANDPKQIDHYLDKLAATGVANRTIENRLGYVQSFLIASGIKHLIQPHHWPKCLKKEPNAYTRVFLQKLFAAMSPEDRITYKFFLHSGCREQEVMYMAWADINFERGTCQVREKKQYRWVPKDYEERTIPLPSAFLAELAERRRQRPADDLIFPSIGGKPNGHFLRHLKRLVYRAGLNCGQCTNKKGLSCKKAAVCDEIELHRFRRTFATLAHHGGQSVKTVQRWLGHADIETTMRYLAAAEDDVQQVREALDQAFAFVA
jgi:integrase/recombinase XerD